MIMDIRMLHVEYQKMRNLKSILMIVLTIALMCGSSMVNSHRIFASENKEDDSEIVSGTVYQFGIKGKYNLSPLSITKLIGLHKASL